MTILGPLCFFGLIGHRPIRVPLALSTTGWRCCDCGQPATTICELLGHGGYVDPNRPTFRRDPRYPLVTRPH